MGKFSQKILRLLKEKGYLRYDRNIPFGDVIFYKHYRFFSKEEFYKDVNLRLWEDIISKYFPHNSSIMVNTDVPQKQYDELFKFLDKHHFRWGNGDDVYNFLEEHKRCNLGQIKTLFINGVTHQLTWSPSHNPRSFQCKTFISNMEALKKELNERADEIFQKIEK
jgi:hypothetical protein